MDIAYCLSIRHLLEKAIMLLSLNNIEEAKKIMQSIIDDIDTEIDEINQWYMNNMKEDA